MKYTPTIHTDVIIHGIGERLVVFDAVLEDVPITLRAIEGERRSILVPVPGYRCKRTRPSLPQYLWKFIYRAWVIRSTTRKRLQLPPLTWPPVMISSIVGAAAITAAVLWVCERFMTWCAFVLIGLGLSLGGK